MSLNRVWVEQAGSKESNDVICLCSSPFLALSPIAVAPFSESCSPPPAAFSGPAGRWVPESQTVRAPHKPVLRPAEFWIWLPQLGWGERWRTMGRGVTDSEALGLEGLG